MFKTYSTRPEDDVVDLEAIREGLATIDFWLTLSMENQKADEHGAVALTRLVAGFWEQQAARSQSETTRESGLLDPCDSLLIAVASLIFLDEEKTARNLMGILTIFRRLMDDFTPNTVTT